MLFTHTWEKILSGEKTQTRRIRKPEHDISAAETCIFAYRPYRILWEVGHKYAVQPGRGKPTIKYAFTDANTLAYWHPSDPLPSVQEWIPARIRITNIRQECVGDISEADAVAEGFTGRDEFLRVFKQINPKSGLNTPVWVLTFELVKG
jgi:hypothetical protein